MILNVNAHQKIWFTSDTHFGHKNILKYNPATRIGSSIEDHDSKLIENWRIHVAPHDIVFHLGDFAFAKHDRILQILDQLPGNIILVKGNHDKLIMKSPALLDRFKSVHSDLTVFIDNQMVVLYHYPIAEHDQMHRGAFHFFGHVHGGKVPGMSGRIQDVGIDSRESGDMMLWEWEELRDKMLLLPFGNRTHS